MSVATLVRKIVSKTHIVVQFIVVIVISTVFKIICIYVRIVREPLI